MAFPNYSYSMASMGYGPGPANPNKIPAYPVNGLGLGGSGMDMIHPAMNPYPPGEARNWDHRVNVVINTLPMPLWTVRYESVL